MRFERLEADYLDYQKSALKPTSYKTLEARLKNHIERFFRRQRLPIKPKKLIDFKNYLDEKPIAQAYKRELYTDLATMLNFAYRLYGIEATTKRVKNFKRPPKKPMTVYTEKEYYKMRQELKSPMYEALFDLLYFGGLRRGEALALTPQDVQAGYVTISKTYTMRRIMAPKTAASQRTIKLPPKVAEELEALKKGLNGRERIFARTSYTSVKRHLDKAADKAKTKRLRVHDLRHSNITLLLYEGFTPQGIAKRVGHSDVETLLNTYAEVRNEEDERIAARLESDIKKRKGKKKTP
jgi:integrase